MTTKLVTYNQKINSKDIIANSIVVSTDLSNIYIETDDNQILKNVHLTTADGISIVNNITGPNLVLKEITNGSFVNMTSNTNLLYMNYDGTIDVGITVDGGADINSLVENGTGVNILLRSVIGGTYVSIFEGVPGFLLVSSPEPDLISFAEGYWRPSGISSFYSHGGISANTPSNLNIPLTLSPASTSEWVTTSGGLTYQGYDENRKFLLSVSAAFQIDSSSVKFLSISPYTLYNSTQTIYPSRSVQGSVNSETESMSLYAIVNVPGFGTKISIKLYASAIISTFNIHGFSISVRKLT